jgi:BirA family biotin operon repressor/biotin-[acetyl-CoA-carboxylase] ligase
MSEIRLPPLFRGEPLTGPADPFDRAIALAIAGTDAGTVVYNLDGPQLRASLVFAPEKPLEEAMAALPVCGLGLQAALGALAPPEVAVHLTWNGGIKVNGALCGRFRVKASSVLPETEPDWLVVGLELDMVSPKDNPGTDPERTYLSEEGCGEVAAPALLEAWVRHSLYWINRWLDEGVRPVHDDWRALVTEIGEEVDIDGKAGTFVGVDENFGMLLRQDAGTTLIPLSSRLET